MRINQQWLTAALAIAVLAASTEQVFAADCDRSALVITGATLWTPAGLQTDREIIVADGRVQAVGQSGRVPRRANSRVIDARGDTLLPGLIDAHAHLVLAGATTPEHRGDPRSHVYPATARQLLRSGVTSARIHLWDLKDGPAFSREAADDCTPSPRLELGGPGFIGGAPASDGGAAWGVKDEADARNKVLRVRDAGAKWVAIHSLDRFEPTVLRAIVSSGRDANLRIMVQADTFEQVRRGLDLGADSLEYIDRTTAKRYPQDLIAGIKARGRSIFLVPPIGYYHRFMRYRADPTMLDDERLIEFMSAESGRFMIDALRAERLKPLSGAGLSIAESFAVLPAKFRQLRDAGLPLIVGSDCGSTAHMQADAIWWELDTWRALGTPAADVIAAATSLSAAALGLQDVGEIVPGHRADLLLYRGALTNGRLDVARVRTVVKGGVLYVHDGQWVGR